METTRNAHSKQEPNQQIRAPYLAKKERSPHPPFFTKCLYYLQHLFRRRLFILSYMILVETILYIETLDIKYPVFGKYYASGLKRHLYVPPNTKSLKE